jgi:hypothetical protein
MSYHDYEVSKELVTTNPPFAALIMAAARKADSLNFAKLESAFRPIIRELQERYDAPGGFIDTEAEAQS